MSVELVLVRLSEAGSAPDGRTVGSGVGHGVVGAGTGNRDGDGAGSSVG